MQAINAPYKLVYYWMDGVYYENELDIPSKPKPCQNKVVKIDGVKYKLTAI